MGLVAIFTVFLAGFSINSHQSGTEVKNFTEAKNIIVSDVVGGYSQEEFTSFKLND